MQQPLSAHPLVFGNSYRTFLWQRVASLGVGTEPIPRKQLTAERLAQAIQKAVADQTMRQRAADLGAKIRTEDGIANAVAVIQEIENIQQAFRLGLIPIRNS